MIVAKIRYVKKVIELENQKNELWDEIRESWDEIDDLDEVIMTLREKLEWHKFVHVISGMVIVFLLYSHHLV